MESDKICTDVQQYKKFIELGIDVNTADMYWLNRTIDLTQTKYALFVVDRSDKHIDFFNSYAVAVEKGEIIPAWSLSALLGFMPKVESVGYEQYPILEHDDEGYSMSSPIYNTDYYDNPIDAAVEMVVRLKENGKLWPKNILKKSDCRLGKEVK